MTWDNFEYWQSGEWQVVQERLDDLEKAGKVINPSRDKLFASLDSVEFDNVRVIVVGQDPYPQHRYCTGLAFDIPDKFQPHEYPPTLTNLFKEYVSDLHYIAPQCGSLTKWAKEGVLLWNSTPSCENGKSLSHQHWVEWDFLNREILEKLSKKGVVVATLGSRAREVGNKYTITNISPIISVSHPSPRASLRAKEPFFGSRLFSSINANLCNLGLGQIDWRL